MAKNILLLLFLFSFSILDAQVDLVFPKNNYVFDNTTINFSWNDYTGATDYQLQIATDTNFSTIVINQNGITTSDYTVSALTTNEKYFWRVKADNSTWSSIQTFIIVDFRTWAQIEFILDPDSVVLDANGKVQQWTDLSGNGNNFTQSDLTKRPLQIVDSSTNNCKVIDFNPSQQNFLQGQNLSSLTQGEIYALSRKHVFPPVSAVYTGIWRFGLNGQNDHYPYTDQNIYSGFGSSTRYTISSIPLDYLSNHLLNISSNASFKFRINNQLIFTSNSNISGFNNSVTIGRSINTYYFDGQFGEILLFNTVLSDSLRNIVNTFYQCKYAPPINLGKRMCGMIPTLHAQKYFKSYLWSDGSTDDSLNISTAGTYWCKATDIFGNVSYDTIEVIDFPSINQPTLPTYCPGESITWETNVGNGYTYQWSDGSSTDSLVISTPGDYYVKVSDTLGCSRLSDTLHFTEDTFHSSISLGADTAFCQGNTITLQAGASQAVSYLWNTGETTPDIQPQTTGDYSVTAINSNGCTAKDTINVTINGIAPTVVYELPLSACSGVNFTFTDTSFTTDGSIITNRAWSFGDGNFASVAQGTHRYDSSGFYSVNLNVTTSNGCTQNLTKIVFVNTTPMVNFTSQFSCEKKAVNFMGNVLNGTTVSNWTWNFDDAGSGSSNMALGQNTSHNFTADGNFNVQLIGSDVNGCSDTVVLVKNIKPAPHPNFLMDTVCAGGIAHFTNLTTISGTNNTIQANNWTFGNGFGSQFPNPQTQYNFAGNYNVRLEATGSNGCTNDTTIVVRIHDVPNVQQIISNNCAELNTVFKDNSSVVDGSIQTVLWRINNGTLQNGAQVQHTFNYPGGYNVEQTVNSSFGCVKTTTFNITIHEPISVDFTVSPNALIAGYPVKFTNQSVGINQQQWQFGSYTSTQKNDTTIIFPDSWIDSVVNVQLIGSNSFGCVDTAAQHFTISGRSTDLALTQVIFQDFDGYLKMGVRLKNLGSTPINQVELKVDKTGMGIFKETWSGVLLQDDSTVYVFSALPLNTVPDKDSVSNYICVTGSIIQPSQFIESTFYNNEICEAISTENPILLVPYPNPVGDALTLKIILPKAEIGRIDIADANGKLVYVAKDLSLNIGLNELNINTSDWTKGTYNVIWKGEHKSSVVRFVKN